MRSDNIRRFAQFSKSTLSRLRERVEEATFQGNERRYAFVGNMANINYIRALPLRRRGLSVDLVLHPQDDFAFAQPAWEEFDGEIASLRDASSLDPFRASLPDWVHRPSTRSDWKRLILKAERTVTTPQQVLLWPEYMPFFPTLDTLSRYDALLVSQFPYLGFFSGRPYLFSQIGGEIWFEASRNDALGILTRRAIASSYAVLVTNPITLAQARRYGLRNLLYVPWPLDEDTYSPGDGSELRDEWKSRVGGDFFVLTSMRMDRHWKGAQHALEGFQRFAADAPQARLVIVGWGDDLEFARSCAVEWGLEQRILFLPTLGKRRLIRCLQAADVVIEQFVLGYYGASGLEAMACGKPTIMRIERDQYDALVDAGAPPTLDAETSTDVERHLSRLYGDRNLCRAIGGQTREWFLAAQSSQMWFDTYKILLEAMASGIPLSYDDSPLCEPLSTEERDYHSAQLLGAPPFPHYVDP